MSTVLPRPMLLVLTGLITLLWTANVIIGFFQPDRAQTAVNAVFMIVAAVVYRQLRRRATSDAPGDGDAAADEPDDEDTIADLRRRLGELIAGDDERAGDDP